MKKLEAQSSPKVMEWFSSQVSSSSPVEIKHTRGSSSFNMRELKEHQRNYLLAATTGRGCYWKIPDYGTFNPFDYMLYKNAPAYVNIVYPEHIYAIEIHDILKIETPFSSRNLSHILVNC